MYKVAVHNHNKRNHKSQHDNQTAGATGEFSAPERVGLVPTPCYYILCGVSENEAGVSLRNLGVFLLKI
ncbi:hypothetical protein AMELA_G00247690 [Ameiurus melas]|uniref:Uncharacterized protein n=1 Tax=Ameiurus melas TaxID=219545 RepID=A0A7J5ZVW9_AMEME|nr:hypothetical protein AMELA_G00247690 [Ameiurus melas]